MTLVGSTIGSYHITELVGEGGMATVYRAVHRVLNRDVAFKVLRPMLTYDEGFVARFEREARILAQLEHPNIVKVYDAGNLSDSFYIAMEFLDGEPLDRLLERHQRLPARYAVDFAIQAANALAYVHTHHNLIHRDVKPANLVLLRDGQTVKVLDFGVAAILRGGSKARSSSGTHEYMPYEQIQGGADERSDVYSLGATLYHLVTGTQPPPFAVELAVSPSHGNPDVSQELDQIILRSIRRDPLERFQTASEMENALRQALPGLGVPGPEEALVVQPPARQVGSPSPQRPSSSAGKTRVYDPGTAPHQPPESKPQRTMPWLWIVALLIVAGGSVGGMLLVPRMWAPTIVTPISIYTVPPSITPHVTTTITPTPSTEPSVELQWQTLKPLDGAEYPPGSWPDAFHWSGPALDDGQRYEIVLDDRAFDAASQPEFVLEPDRVARLDWPLGRSEHRWSVRVVDSHGTLVGQPGPVWAFAVVVPTPAPLPSDTPTVFTATSTPQPATRAPTFTPVPAAVKPVLVFPEQGQTYPNPIAFQWQGNLGPGQAYRVVVRHTESGTSIPSGLLTSSSWSTGLPADKFGEWRWTVAVVQSDQVVVSSSEWSFWFNPISGGGGNGGDDGKPPPTP